MAADRRWNERRFILEESTTLNGGARTVFIEHMTPNTTVPPHWHNSFSETFDLISGSMKVYIHDTPDLDALEASAQPISIGKLATIPAGKYHRYQAGDEETVVRVILTPGYQDFERLTMIMNGLAEDGELEGLTDSVKLMAVVMDLADAHLIGPLGEMLEAARKEHKEEIAALKERLLGKYDNEESLRKLMEKETL